MDTATTHDTRRLWVVRVAWLIVAIIVLGNLAVMTPGNALDATAMPVLTAGATLFTIACYPVMKRIAGA